MTKTYEVYASICTFFLLYLSSAFSLSPLGGTIRLILFGILTLFIMLFGFLHRQKGMTIPFLSLCMFLIATTSNLFNGESVKTHFIVALYFFLSIIFCAFININIFAKVYVKVMYLLALCSVVLYFVDIIGVPLDFLPSTQNVMELETKTIFLALAPINGRNLGLFWEPGAFQTYLCLALIIDAFVFKFEKKLRATVIIVAIITTFSSSGYIALILIMIALALTAAIENDGRRNMFIILCAFLVGLYMASVIIKNYFPHLEYTLFGKLEGLFVDDIDSETSAGVRYNSIVEGFTVFLKNPVFGVGLTKMNAYFEENFGNTMTTCTFVNWFAYFGIGYGLISVYSFFRLSRYFSNKKILRIILCVVLFIIVFSENYALNPSIMIITIYGLSRDVKAGTAVFEDECLSN